jgi:prevent-host-death family protein
MRAISSREFNQDVGQAKRAARFEPVFVTDRGRPTHVLMSIEAFQRLSGESESIVDLLALPGIAPVAEPDRRDGDAWRRRAGGG